MCSNYRPVTRSDRMLTFFGIERPRDEPPVDVWPLGLAPFIRLAEPGAGPGGLRVVDDGHFGLLPHFQAELAAGRRTYNARSETVHRLPSFRDAWARGQRCIVPVECIYEPNWETGRAVRWRIRQPGDLPLGVAGIYTRWRDPQGRERLTFAMLTVNADAHPLMRRFHKPGDEKRMVAILAPADYGAWLACPVSEALAFLAPWDGALEAEPAPLPPRLAAGAAGGPAAPGLF